MQEHSMKTRESISRFLPPLVWVLVTFFFSAQPAPYGMVLDRPSPSAVPLQKQESPTLAAAQPPVISEQWRISTIFPKTDEKQEVLGRYLHVLEYAILSFLLTRTLIWKSPLNLVLLLTTFFISALYALSDEYHQMFIPGRRFETGDILLDILGAGGGILFFILLYIWKVKRTVA